MAEIQQALVSIGIPTYNRPDGLRRTLEYITNQTYKNIEVIVSDNCSPGNDVRSIVNKFVEHDSRIKFYQQETQTGVNNNFKFVFRESCGQYFMWAADDNETNRIDS